MSAIKWGSAQSQTNLVFTSISDYLFRVKILWGIFVNLLCVSVIYKLIVWGINNNDPYLISKFSQLFWGALTYTGIGWIIFLTYRGLCLSKKLATVLIHCYILNSILYGCVLFGVAIYGKWHMDGAVNVFLGAAGAGVGFLLSWLMVLCYILSERCAFWQIFSLWCTVSYGHNNKEMRGAMIVAFIILFPILLGMVFIVRMLSRSP